VCKVFSIGDVVLDKNGSPADVYRFFLQVYNGYVVSHCIYNDRHYIIFSIFYFFIMKNIALSSGYVASVADAVVVVKGLDRAFIGEVVSFRTIDSDELGLVLNIEKEVVRVALINGTDKKVRAMDRVFQTSMPARTKVGFGMIGRIVTPLGVCINQEDFDPAEYVLNELFGVRYASVEAKVAGIIEREPVRTPVLTGINAIDSLLPIGCGQRELIIGDLGSGKTSLALTVILNQKYRNYTLYKLWRKMESNRLTYRHRSFVPCVYVVIGGRRAEISRIKRLLKDTGASKYTVVVFTSADDLAALQYLAPFAGCSVGEWFRDNGYKSIVIYDELLNHAAAYRQVSLLLRRPPGREAFPGDIFYLHARLLERAAQLNRRLGGGALTALPVVETKSGDISAYIPTNIISITDGQIFLSSKLGNSGVKPAVDLNLSVSRVGSDAQYYSMKYVSKRVRVTYGLYRTYAGIEKMSADIDPMIMSFINRGKKLLEYFKQDLYETETLYKQLVCLYTIADGYLDDVDTSLVKYYFNLMFQIKIAPAYLKDSKLYYLITRSEVMNSVIISVDFMVLKAKLDIWLQQYNKAFKEQYEYKVDRSVAKL